MCDATVNKWLTTCPIYSSKACDWKSARNFGHVVDTDGQIERSVDQFVTVYRTVTRGVRTG